MSLLQLELEALRLMLRGQGIQEQGGDVSTKQRPSFETAMVDSESKHQRVIFYPTSSLGIPLLLLLFNFEDPYMYKMYRKHDRFYKELQSKCPWASVRK